MHETPTQVVELVANLDDATGERLGGAIEALIAAGALDAWATPIVMKKGRPAVMLSVLCPDDRRDAMVAALFEQTGTFGVRYRRWDRAVLDRRHVAVMTEFGDVRIKVGARGGRDVTAKAEYDDAAAVAAAHGVPVGRVIDAAMAAYHGRRPA